MTAFEPPIDPQTEAEHLVGERPCPPCPLAEYLDVLIALAERERRVRLVEPLVQDGPRGDAPSGRKLWK